MTQKEFNTTKWYKGMPCYSVLDVRCEQKLEVVGVDFECGIIVVKDPRFDRTREHRHFQSTKLEGTRKKEKLISIPVWRLEIVFNALRLVEQRLNSVQRVTCLDRNVMSALNVVVNALNEDAEGQEHYMTQGQYPILKESNEKENESKTIKEI